MPKPGSFQEVLARAVEDMLANGFDSVERVQRWTRELAIAAERSMASGPAVDQSLRDGLAAVYRRLVDRGQIITKFNAGIDRFTLDKVRPALRAELDRRIMASADLIKRNREQAIDKTLQRFQGWSTSIPKGGTKAADPRKAKLDVRKALRSLPFEERRVLIDQGHKMTASLNEILAMDGGAIAGLWVSHYNQPGYQFRLQHKERDHRQNDGQPFLIRDSWAHRAGFVKKGKLGYTDEVTAPATEPFCRCLPGTTRIPFADVEMVSRRWYNGPSITIKTVSGREITSTPNHPILSLVGWRSAENFKPGDYVIEVVQKVRESTLSYGNQNDAVPTIEDVFCSFVKFGSAQVRSGRVEDFHGDGIVNNDVDIVTATRTLLIDCVSTKPQSISEFRLAQSYFSRSGIGLLCETKFRSFFASTIEVLLSSIANLFGVLFGAQNLRFGYAADGNANRDKTTAYRGLMDVKLPSDLFESNPIFVCLSDGVEIECKASRVIEIDRKVFAGHVFNLQTTTGAYLANGIVTHNCYYRYLYNLRDLPEDMLTAKGAAMLGSARGQEEARVNRFARADDAGAPGDDRISQAEANYSPTWSNSQTRCARCSMFVTAGGLAGACAAVTGSISAHGHCKLWEPLGAKRALPSGVPVPVDRDHDVAWMSVVSRDGKRLYLDRTLPRVVTIKGKTFDPARLLWAHEHREWEEMLTLLAALLEKLRRQPTEAERKAIYRAAHAKGIEGERNEAKRMGVDWDAWEAWSRGELARLEHRKIENPPPDPHVRPAPHDRRWPMEDVAA